MENHATAPPFEVPEVIEIQMPGEPSSSSNTIAVRTMGLEEKYQILRSIAEECIQEDELRNLLVRNPEPICYDGFEPSGRMHIAQPVRRHFVEDKTAKDLLKRVKSYKVTNEILTGSRRRVSSIY